MFASNPQNSGHHELHQFAGYACDIHGLRMFTDMVDNTGSVKIHPNANLLITTHRRPSVFVPDRAPKL